MVYARNDIASEALQLFLRVASEPEQEFGEAVRDELRQRLSHPFSTTHDLAVPWRRGWRRRLAISAGSYSSLAFHRAVPHSGWLVQNW